MDLWHTLSFVFLYFILREMTHDETAPETQYQNDDGEDESHRSCSPRCRHPWC